MATPITVSIPHRLGKAEARARVSAGFDQFQSQLSAAPMAKLSQAWAGDRLSFSAQMLGQTIAGRIDVGDTDVRIEIDLPAFLAGMAEKIAGRLRREAPLLLEKK